MLKKINVCPWVSFPGEGQNFLVSEEILSEIVAAAELTPDDTVLEIGPGLGVLTSALGERAGLVLAVEKDKKIYSVLRKLFKNKKNVKIINEDALFMDFSVILNSIQDLDSETSSEWQKSISFQQTNSKQRFVGSSVLMLQ